MVSCGPPTAVPPLVKEDASVVRLPTADDWEVDPKATLSWPRAIEMPTRAARETKARKPLSARSSNGGMRLTSGLGGIAPGRISRQIAAMKQKALNSTNALPTNFVSPGCMTV